ncbi:MAG: hypothetical protein M3Q29_24470, partial [Chloroflexota bacterium]|nr:hypothetical protein [Chloroflexota bacterium]
MDRMETARFRGDVLATGVQSCRLTSNAPRGVDLWDVTDPRNPRHLAFWPSGTVRSGSPRGVHELDIFQRGNRAYLAVTVPFSEFKDGQGDLRLVDITDPRKPRQVSDWGAIRDGGLVPRLGKAIFAHAVDVDETGTRAAVSYWDAGAILLDITDPAAPIFIGSTVYPRGSEGNTHSAEFVGKRRYMVTTDEDINPKGGWGFLRIWDVGRKGSPLEVARFATRHSNQSQSPAGGIDHLITNDKFCMTRQGHLTLNWSRYEVWRAGQERRTTGSTTYP